ncbi:hypothetical protein B4099_1903 [Heyndrickxia coagulans]|uniref:Uncharacterized protein n=1 Tax=Heyndrickxia coagulans TaxID=1398 RepID=A0A150K2M3_HEYCO|nr:hypothetical protein B4099_1903 [Heyndrickxia coagulans]
MTAGIGREKKKEEKKEERRKKRIVTNDSNCHQNVAGGYGSSIHCGKNKTAIGAFVRWESGFQV